MKHNMVRSFVVFVVIAMLAGFATSAFAQDAPQLPRAGDTWKIATTDPLGVRSGHSTSDTRLGELSNGTEVVVLEVWQNSDSTEIWVRHTTGTLSGWSAVKDATSVYMTFVKASPFAAATPVLGITEEQLNQWLTQTDTSTVLDEVAPMLSLLDNTYNTLNKTGVVAGGAWGMVDTTPLTLSVPTDGALLWTDFLADASGVLNPLPSGVERVRTQGNWGVYKTTPGTTQVVIPTPNGGGRWLPIVTAAVVSPAAPVVGAGTNCVDPATMQTITTSADPVTAFNGYFESTGYLFGGQATANLVVPANSFVLARGGVFTSVAGETVVEGGRYMTMCPPVAPGGAG